MPIKEKNAAANRQHQQIKSDSAVLSAKPLVTQWEKMVVNPIAAPVTRTPSISPFTGAARIFVRTFDVNSAGAGSPFNVVASPNLEGTLRMTKPSAVILDPAGWILTGEPSVDSSTAWLGKPTLACVFAVFDSNVNPTGESVRTSWDPVNKMDYLEMSGGGLGNGVTVKVIGEFLSYNVYVLKAGGWAIDKASVDAGDSCTINPDDPYTGMLITVSGVTGKIASWNITNSSGVDPLLQSLTSYDLFSTDAATLSRVSAYRVTAMSILASYSGSTLDNGGTIAAARTRAGFRYDAQSEYGALTKLQDHVYRGTLKEGAYVWWLPYDFEELDPRPPQVVNSGTELHLAGHFDNADASLQVTVAMVVEFYSPLQIFEHEVGPALTDAFVMGYHALDSVPAGTCNPKHDSLLKKIIKSSAKGAKKAGQYALSHPEMVSMLASSLI